MAVASNKDRGALTTSAKDVTVIQPSSGWSALNLREIWQYRDLLLPLAARDVKLRYRQTALGAVWVILQPLVAALIFTFVFDKVANLPSDGLPYLLFAYAGLLGWNAFSSTLSRSSGSLVGNAHLVAKIYFPRLILPLAVLYSTLIDFSVALTVMAALMLIYGVPPHIGLLLLPLWLLLILLLALGFGLFASAVTVTYRDVQHILPVLTQFVMYASPVAYAVSAVPASLRPFYFLNPLSGLLEAFRWSLLGTHTFRWEYVAYSATVACVVFVTGAFTFKKMERRFSDVI